MRFCKDSPKYNSNFRGSNNCMGLPSGKAFFNFLASRQLLSNIFLPHRIVAKSLKNNPDFLALVISHVLAPTKVLHPRYIFIENNIMNATLLDQNLGPIRIWNLPYCLQRYTARAARFRLYRMKTIILWDYNKDG